MAQIVSKWIADDAIDASKINIGNQTFLKGRNNADNADVDIVKVNATDRLEFASIPQVTSAPLVDNDLARKKYVDDQIASVPAIPATFQIQGNWNADTNTPTLVSSTNDTGDTNPLYIITVAGTTSINGENLWSAGDHIYFANGIWNKADNVDDVLSVAGKTGIITLDTDDVSEGANLYFTNTRAKDAVVENAAYSGAWNGVTDKAPSKDAVFDKMETKAAEADVIKKNGSVAFTADQPMGDNKITGIKDGTLAQDAVSKSQMETAISNSAGSTNGREKIILDGTDISNGYIELLQPALANSLSVQPVGGPQQTPVDDFTESIVVTNTRVTFAGDLATLLVSGDELILYYEY